MRMPVHCRAVARSCNNSAEKLATKIGCISTSTTELATVVKPREATQAQKCAASSTPATIASDQSRRLSRNDERLVLRTANTSAMSATEITSRHAETTGGGAVANLTSGPAQLIALTAISRTSTGGIGGCSRFIRRSGNAQLPDESPNG